MDVEASCAIRQAEVGASQTMIERTDACFASSLNGSWQTLVKEQEFAPHI